MPYEITYRKTKIGFNSPITDWIRGPLKTFFEDTINSSDFNSCSLINSKNIYNKINYIIDNKNSSFSDGEEAWTAISPYFWEKAVIKNNKWRKNK